MTLSKGKRTLRFFFKSCLQVIRSVCSGERENHEPQKSAQEVTQKIQDLQKKIDQARSQVS